MMRRLLILAALAVLGASAAAGSPARAITLIGSATVAAIRRSAAASTRPGTKIPLAPAPR